MNNSFIIYNYSWLDFVQNPIKYLFHHKNKKGGIHEHQLMSG